MYIVGVLFKLCLSYNVVSIYSDMWAIGVISYFLLCGYTPFERENNVDEMNAIMHADYTFDEQYWSTISDEGKRRKEWFYRLK